MGCEGSRRVPFKALLKQSSGRTHEHIHCWSLVRIRERYNRYKNQMTTGYNTVPGNLTNIRQCDSKEGYGERGTQHAGDDNCLDKKFSAFYGTQKLITCSQTTAFCHYSERFRYTWEDIIKIGLWKLGCGQDSPSSGYGLKSRQLPLRFHVGGKFLNYRASFRDRPYIMLFSVSRIKVNACFFFNVGAHFVRKPVL
jgi:hypothetical protein